METNAVYLPSNFFEFILLLKYEFLHDYYEGIFKNLDYFAMEIMVEKLDFFKIFVLKLKITFCHAQ